MRRRPVYYSFKIGLNLVLLAVGWAVRHARAVVVADAGPVFLAVMFTQTGFIGHDAGHRQISGSKRADGLIGRIHGNLLIGLSHCWWVSKHNRHHAHPNQIGRDWDPRRGQAHTGHNEPLPRRPPASPGNQPVQRSRP